MRVMRALNGQFSLEIVGDSKAVMMELMSLSEWCRQGLAAGREPFEMMQDLSGINKKK